MSRYASILAITGVHAGILGVIIAAGAPDVTRQSGTAIWGGFFAWIVGLIFVIVAYVQASRPE